MIVRLLDSARATKMLDHQEQLRGAPRHRHVGLRRLQGRLLVF